MIIRATDKAPNEIVLASISRSLKKGQELPINDEQYRNVDIQTCLQRKWIEIVKGSPIDPIISKIEGFLIKCISDSQVILPSIPKTLKINDTYLVPKNVFGNTDIQQAMQKKFIVCLGEQIGDSVKLFNGEILPASKIIPSNENSPDVGENEVIVVPAEKREKIDMEGLSDAEKFALTGQAQIIERDVKAPTDTHYVICDPREEAAQRTSIEAPMPGKLKNAV